MAAPGVQQWGFKGGWGHFLSGFQQRFQKEKGRQDLHLEWEYRRVDISVHL